MKRIEKAKWLLRARSLSVTDICFEVGFESLGSFSSLFRKCVGDAPNNYRRREQESLKKIPGCFIQMFGLCQTEHISNFREARDASNLLCSSQT